MERNAESAILKWCRSSPRGMGHPVMRNGHDGECLVLDVYSTEPGPLWPGHRRSRTLARCATWEKCAEVLGIEVG